MKPLGLPKRRGAREGGGVALTREPGDLPMVVVRCVPGGVYRRQVEKRVPSRPRALPAMDGNPSMGREENP